jgi:hypothetical protein
VGVFDGAMCGLKIRVSAVQIRLRAPLFKKINGLGVFLKLVIFVAFGFQAKHFYVLLRPFIGFFG